MVRAMTPEELVKVKEIAPALPCGFWRSHFRDDKTGCGRFYLCGTGFALHWCISAKLQG
jgi:uncharacterized membrane protein